MLQREVIQGQGYGANVRHLKLNNVLYLKFDESSSGTMIQKIKFKNLNKKIFIQTKAKETTKNLVKLRSIWKRTWNNGIKH